MAKVSFQMSDVEHKEWFISALPTTYPDPIDETETHVVDRGS